MRIAISTCSMVSCDKDFAGTGLGVYLDNLVTFLQKEASDDQFYIFMPESQRRFFKIKHKNFKAIYLKEYTNRLIPGLLWYFFLLPLLLKRYKIDCLHIPDFRRFPLIKVCPIVLTIHDMTNFIVKGRLTTTKKIYRYFIKYVFSKYADRIVTVSDNTKKDVVNVLGIDPAKITVVHNGVSKEFCVRERKSALKELKSFDPPERSILYVSRLEHPLKNHITLLRAYARCKEEKDFAHKLIFIGERWSGHEAIFVEIKRLGLGGDVIMLEKISFKALTRFYNIADLFVFPSLYEGFGLPAVEALASGVPVIASDTSSLKEIVGGSGLLFKPGDDLNLSELILKVLDDKNLRSDMIQKGLSRSSEYCWKAVASSMLSVYRSSASRVQ